MRAKEARSAGHVCPQSTAAIGRGGQCDLPPTKRKEEESYNTITINYLFNCLLILILTIFNCIHMQICINSRQFWNFWRITRVSIISHCKVIWSITVWFFLAHPVYAGCVHFRILRHLYQCSPPISMLRVKRHKSPRSEWYLRCFDNLRIKFLFLYIFTVIRQLWNINLKNNRYFLFQN